MIILLYSDVFVVLNDSLIAVPAGGAGGQLPPQVSKIWAKP